MPYVRSIMLIMMLSLAVGCKERAGEVPSAPGESAAAENVEHPLPPSKLGRSYRSVETRQTAAGILNVFVAGKNITNFGNPHHIYTAEVSPTDRYLLVWHMDFTPRKLSVYDLATGEKLTTFEPGAGGRIQWAHGDVIYHQRGAGTNTAIFNVYNVKGQTLWRGLTSGAALCDSGRYVLVLPSLPVGGEEILIVDVRNGDVLGRARPKDFENCETYTWLDGRTVRVWYDTLDHDGLKTIDIPIDPANPVKWEG